MQSVFVLIAAAAQLAPRPIVDGQLDGGDEAVVGLVADGRVTCSGTVVAPRVVLTAAHCVAATVEDVLVGADLASGRRVPVVYTRAHPTADVAVVFVGESLAMPPRALATAAPAVGSTLRLVGFGQTGVGDASAPAKREGTAVVAAIAADELELRRAPSLTCDGDSGGPAFVAAAGGEVLAGITVAGDARCAAMTRSLRVELVAGWVGEIIEASTAGTARVGERCLYDGHCAGAARCVRPDDAPGVAYCAAACDASRECPLAMACTARECRYPAPSPGSLGSPCAAYSDCDSLLCASGTCSRACAAGTCPAGYECRADDEQPALQACFATAPTGGCGVAGDGGSAGAVLLALALARRRRRDRTATSTVP